MRRAVLSVMLLAAACSSLPLLHPTPQRPVAMCHLSCPESRGPDEGWLFRPQHLCRGIKRWFDDIRVIGEYVVRSVDGTVNVAVWISCENGWRPDGFCGTTADYPKSDVIAEPCDAVINSIKQTRSASERGHNPGDQP